MQKILIADTSRAFCEAVAQAIPQTYQVITCWDGAQLPEILKSVQPDGLVLDLLLSGADGLYILETIYQAGLRPAVLVTTAFYSDYIRVALERIQISEVLIKPCNPTHVAVRIADMVQTMQMRMFVSDESQAERFLRGLGFYPHLSGFPLLVSAICLLWENPNMSFTKELYPAVAQRCGGDWKQVEHAIRTCIQSAYKRRDDWIWQLYFPVGREKKVVHLKNSVFLKCAVEALAQGASCVPQRPIAL